MALLTVGAVELPIRPETAVMTPLDIGETTRGLDGSMRTSRRAAKRQWAFETSLLPYEDANAWRSLLLGRGHYWSFEGSSLTSASGLSASSSTGVAFSGAAGTVRVGSVSMQLAATTGSVSWGVGSHPLWTVGYWRGDGTGAWNHHIRRSDGKGWLNAARDDTAPPSLVTSGISGGTLTLNVDAGANRYIDDVWLVPYLVPASWMASIQLFVLPFPVGPVLSIQGDFVSGSSLSSPAYAVGQVTAAKYVQGVLEDDWGQALQSLSVVLMEV